jgi:hypothetical protein
MFFMINLLSSGASQKKKGSNSHRIEPGTLKKESESKTKTEYRRLRTHLTYGGTVKTDDNLDIISLSMPETCWGLQMIQPMDPASAIAYKSSLVSISSM